MTATKKTRTSPRTSFHVHDVDGQLVVEVRTERPRSAKADYYVLTHLPSDFGKAFQLTKLGPEPAVYSCCVEADGSGHCNCKGHESHSHCKHVDALTWLLGQSAL